MSENLSRQLCELCGIEAKQFTKDFKTREKAASFGRKITGIPKFSGNKFDIGSYTDNESIYQVHWKEYPDFTKSENFVRLFNLTLPIRGISSIAEFVTFEYLTITDSKDFLKKLIKSIQEPYTENEVIKSIREAEWVYE